jgi:hypothetical protein
VCCNLHPPRMSHSPAAPTLTTPCTGVAVHICQPLRRSHWPLAPQLRCRQSPPAATLLSAGGPDSPAARHCPPQQAWLGRQCPTCAGPGRIRWAVYRPCPAAGKATA